MSKKRNILRRFSAALMLLLFVFSITPRQDLHDFLANHRDTPVKEGFPGNAGLNTAGFHCNCESQVVESPFIDEPPSLEWLPLHHGAASPVIPISKVYSATVPHTGLRGPPSA